jgi:hypothetical protein
VRSCPRAALRYQVGGSRRAVGFHSSRVAATTRVGDETDDPVHDSPRSEGSPPPSGADGDDDGFHEHIQFGWDTRVSGNGKHEVLTDLTATLFLHAVAGDPYSPSVRCANSSLSAWLGWFVCAEFHRLFGQYGDTVQS